MENYFWNTEETQSVKKLYVLIIYDIVDNKKRLAFAKKLNLSRNFINQFENGNKNISDRTINDICDQHLRQ